jgi:hypothetical protein
VTKEQNLSRLTTLLVRLLSQHRRFWVLKAKVATIAMLGLGQLDGEVEQQQALFHLEFMLLFVNDPAHIYP